MTFPFHCVVQIPILSANKDSLLRVLKRAFWSRRPHYSWKRNPWDMQKRKQCRPPLRNEPANFCWRVSEELGNCSEKSPPLFHRCLWGVQIIWFGRQKFSMRTGWLALRSGSRQQSSYFDMTDALLSNNATESRLWCFGISQMSLLMCCFCHIRLSKSIKNPLSELELKNLQY